MSPVALSVLLLALVAWMGAEVIISGGGTLWEFAFRLCACALFMYCVVRGMAEDKLLNPWILFSVAPLSLLAYVREISPHFLLELAPTTWAIALLNMVAFLVGLYCFRGRGCGEKPKAFLWEEESEGRCAVQAVVLLCISQIGTVIPFLSSTFGLLIYPSIMYALKSRKKLLILVVIGFVLLGFTQSFNKSMAVSFGLALLIHYEGEGGRKGKTAALVALLLLLIIFVAFPLKAFMADGSTFFDTLSSGDFMSFLSDSYEDTEENYEGRIDWEGPAFLMMPYMYLTTAWTNLQYVMQTTGEHTWGLWLLKPILGYLQLDESSFVGTAYELHCYRSTFNTYTFIAVQYVDFGFFGSVLVSLALGCFVRWLYNLSVQRTASPLLLGCWALTAQATSEMFFSNHFFQQSYPFTILILCVLYGTCAAMLSRKGPSKRSGSRHARGHGRLDADGAGEPSGAPGMASARPPEALAFGVGDKGRHERKT